VDTIRVPSGLQLDTAGSTVTAAPRLPGGSTMLRSSDPVEGDAREEAALRVVASAEYVTTSVP
jgi:hypothetical protein